MLVESRGFHNLRSPTSRGCNLHPRIVAGIAGRDQHLTSMGASHSLDQVKKRLGTDVPRSSLAPATVTRVLRHDAPKGVSSWGVISEIEGTGLPTRLSCATAHFLRLVPRISLGCTQSAACACSAAVAAAVNGMAILPGCGQRLGRHLGGLPHQNWRYSPAVW